MLFSYQAIKQLSAPARSKLLAEIDPTTSGAKDRGREPVSVTETWFCLRTLQEQETVIAGGDIAGVVFLSDNANYAVASCVTPFPIISDAMVGFGCQWGRNDISQIEMGQITKQTVNGHVLVPMLARDVQAFQFSHNNHDLSQP